MNVMTFDSPVGWLLLQEENGALSGVRFVPDCFQKTPLTSSFLLLEAKKQLDAYFNGRLKRFDLPLCFHGTAFQERVWRALCEIPYGQTICYETLASRCGNPKACRAVGMANHRNPLAVVVPCHRVVGKNGALTGYAGGLEIKRYLLIWSKKMLHKLHIGCHLSATKGFMAMGRNALKIGADTFQFFTRNPQGGRAKDLDLKDIEAFLELAQEHHFAPLVAHAPYTLNPCSDKSETLEFAEMVFRDDLKRMAFLPNNYYNFHPGSHVGQGVQKGIDFIAKLLNKVLKYAQNTTVLLETMSGKGSEIGARFEEIRAIIERVDCPEKLGVCLDTCHVYSAGYDVVNDLDGVLKEFDAVLGLARLKAVHLNDSKTPFASRKDRHEKIGQGSLGAQALLDLVNHPKLQNLPFILETPNELEGWQNEIEFLRQNSI